MMEKMQSKCILLVIFLVTLVTATEHQFDNNINKIDDDTTDQRQISLSDLIDDDVDNIGDRDIVRRTRLAKPSGIFGFFTTLSDMKRILDDQYNDTTTSLQQILDFLSDGFSDTATTKRPVPTTAAPISDASDTNGTTTEISTTTERYRISRQEFGYILGKNLRGLRKLFNLELNDALNQSKISDAEYRREFGNAIAPYAIAKGQTSKN